MADLSDPASFETLLSPHILPAYRFAYGMLRDRAEAEDVVQESALRAWQHRRSFDAGAKLRPWFFAIVANECRSVMRRPWWKVVRQSESSSEASERRDEEGTLDVRRALRRMGYNERLVVVLRYYLDLDYDEIAITLGISEQAARSRTHRAVRRLRPEMLVSEEPSA